MGYRFKSTVSDGRYCLHYLRICEALGGIDLTHPQHLSHPNPRCDFPAHAHVATAAEALYEGFALQEDLDSSCAFPQSRWRLVSRSTRAGPCAGRGTTSGPCWRPAALNKALVVSLLGPRLFWMLEIYKGAGNGGHLIPYLDQPGMFQLHGCMHPVQRQAPQCRLAGGHFAPSTFARCAFGVSE